MTRPFWSELTSLEFPIKVTRPVVSITVSGPRISVSGVVPGLTNSEAQYATQELTTMLGFRPMVSSSDAHIPFAFL